MIALLTHIVEKGHLGNVPYLALHSAELAQKMRPGQFALVRNPPGLDPYLRHPAWFYEARDERLVVTLDPADVVAERAVEGGWLDVLAPLGRPVEIGPRARRLLLVGQGAGIAPLAALAHEALKSDPGREIVLAGHPGAAGFIWPAHLLSPDIEYHVAAPNEPIEQWPTADLISWADFLVANGSDELYCHLVELIQSTRYRLEAGFAQVLANVEMACGVGACGTCVIGKRRNYRLACKDGPWFDLADWVSLVT